MNRSLGSVNVKWDTVPVACGGGAIRIHSKKDLLIGEHDGNFSHLSVHHPLVVVMM